MCSHANFLKPGIFLQHYSFQFHYPLRIHTNMSGTASPPRGLPTSLQTQHNLTVLISGEGTNLQALIDACASKPPAPGFTNTSISHVVSNKKEAGGLRRAERAGIHTTYHNLVKYKKRCPDNLDQAREEYDTDLAKIILTNQPKPDLVVCAGWMHILKPRFIDSLTDANVPIINLHPAQPGQFDGANAIARAWEAYQRGEIASTGVMVHHVIAEVDQGQPIIVEDVDCRPDEPLADLEARIHEVEWKAIVQGTKMVLDEIRNGQKGEAAHASGKTGTVIDLEGGMARETASITQ